MSLHTPVLRAAARAALFVLLLTGCTPATGARPDWSAREAALPAMPASSAASVDITWLSVTNVYLRTGPVGILTDGYVTRLPENAFLDQTLARSRAAFRPDSAAVARMLGLVGGRDAVQALLNGHSHFDHAFDAAMWAKLSRAEVYGPRTTCFQLAAQNVPASRCTTVEGSETIPLGDGVTMRVVRWNHSGDHAVNPELHDPAELARVPTLDPTNGGLRPGVTEDFPNGGGSRAYLITVPTRDGRLSLFFSNTGSPVDLDRPIVVDGTNYGAPIDNLRAALRDAGLTSVDLWIGSGGAPLARLVLPVLRPKAYLPVHWDDYFSPLERGVAKPYADPSLESLLDSAHVTLVRPAQYLDRWRLDRSGVHAVANDAQKRALGLSR
ncbi:MAG TPA: MBL fold metallo-hydrolase [Gemmatimonadaceae bacterium]